MGDAAVELVNYRQSGAAPLKSITQLPEREAVNMANRLYAMSPCRAHRRFGQNFIEYYRHRQEAEKWLHEHFMALGGLPALHHPYYFVLQGCENFVRSFDSCVEIRIPLKHIAPSDISFTFGDSLAMMDTTERRPPFTVKGLGREIASYGGDFEGFLSRVQAQYGCIEAQVWTDSCFT